MITQKNDQEGIKKQRGEYVYALAFLMRAGPDSTFLTPSSLN